MARYFAFHENLETLPVGASIDFSADESHHLRVLRLDSHDRLEAFDGHGWTAPVENFVWQKKDILRATIGQPKKQPEERTKLILLQGLISRTSGQTIIHQSAALGIHNIFPLITDRSNYRSNSERDSKQQRQWIQIARQSCKQAKNPYASQIQPPQTLENALRQLDPTSLRLVAALTPNSQATQIILPQIMASPPTTIVLAIGPEGDFSEKEYDLLAQKNFLPISLGPRIFTAEMSALALLSALRLVLPTAHESLS